MSDENTEQSLLAITCPGDATWLAETSLPHNYFSTWK